MLTKIINKNLNFFTNGPRKSFLKYFSPTEKLAVRFGSTLYFLVTMEISRENYDITLVTKLYLFYLYKMVSVKLLSCAVHNRVKYCIHNESASGDGKHLEILLGILTQGEGEGHLQRSCHPYVKILL